MILFIFKPSPAMSLAVWNLKGAWKG